METQAHPRKDLVRQMIEAVVGFHPDMTDEQREESIPACKRVLVILASSLTMYIGVVAWVLA
jgi:hypothetical protein